MRDNLTNFAPVTAVLTSPLPAEDTSVALNDVLKTVGALLPSATTNLSLPSKLNISKSYTPALVLPVSIAVQELLPAVAVNIFSPLAATILSLNFIDNKTASVEALVCGTMFVTSLLNHVI